VEELLGVIVGEDDPEVGLQRSKLLADVGRHGPHAFDITLVLALRHGEELRRMGQHCAADHGGHHSRAPSSGVVCIVTAGRGRRQAIRNIRASSCSGSSICDHCKLAAEQTFGFETRRERGRNVICAVSEEQQRFEVDRRAEDLSARDSTLVEA
jgi:hypothetical protein